MNCAFCSHHKCYTSGQNCTRISHEEINEYYTDEDKKMMRASSATESLNYLKMTRLEESAFFAKEMGVKKIGIAFCIGLANEAHFCAQYFKTQGFEVQSVCCKVCSVDKDMMNLDKIKPGQREAMCNPKVQARLLNEGGTELNFIVGLCVGHDMLFTMESKVPALLPKIGFWRIILPARFIHVTGAGSWVFWRKVLSKVVKRLSG